MQRLTAFFFLLPLALGVHAQSITVDDFSTAQNVSRSGQPVGSTIASVAGSGTIGGARDVRRRPPLS